MLKKVTVELSLEGHPGCFSGRRKAKAQIAVPEMFRKPVKYKAHFE